MPEVPTNTRHHTPKAVTYHEQPEIMNPEWRSLRHTVFALQAMVSAFPTNYYITSILDVEKGLLVGAQSHLYNRDEGEIVGCLQ